MSGLGWLIIPRPFSLNQFHLFPALSHAHALSRARVGATSSFVTHGTNLFLHFSIKVKGSSCFDLRQLFLRECAWGGGGGAGAGGVSSRRGKQKSQGTHPMKWREGNPLPTTAGPPGLWDLC